MTYAAPHGVVLKDAHGFFRLLGCKKVLRGNESQDPRAASCEQSVPCSTRWLSPTAGCSCSITHQGAQPLPAHEFVLCCWIWGTRGTGASSPPHTTGSLCTPSRAGVPGNVGTTQRKCHRCLNPGFWLGLRERPRWGQRCRGDALV